MASLHSEPPSPLPSPSAALLGCPCGVEASEAVPPQLFPPPRYAPGTYYWGSGDCGCGHCPGSVELWWQHAEWCKQSLDHATAKVAWRKAGELASSRGDGMQSVIASAEWPRLLREERGRQEGGVEALKGLLFAKYGDLREQPVGASEQEQSGSPPPQAPPVLPSPSPPQPPLQQRMQPQAQPAQPSAIGRQTRVEEKRRAAIAKERAARKDALLAKPLPKPGPSGPVRTPRPVEGAPSGAAQAAREAQKGASITAMHHHEAALKEAEERRVRHLVWQKDMRERGSRITQPGRAQLTGVVVDTPSVVTLGDLMPSSSLPPVLSPPPWLEAATASALPSALSPPPPSALPPPPPSLLPRPPASWTAALPAEPDLPLQTASPPKGSPAPVTPTTEPPQQVMVKVTHGSNTFSLAYSGEVELTWVSLWVHTADRFQLLPGGEAVADAIYCGAATFTYVDADGDSVQLVCEADLAIAVRVTSLLSPPVLRLLVGLVQTGEGGSAAGRSGRGDGGNSGERGNGQSDPEQRGDHPQSQAPEPQPQGGGRTSLPGGSVTARGAAFDASGALTVLCPQGRQWARADAQVLAERGYRRFRRPASVARPSALAEQVAPIVPSLSQPGQGYMFSVLELSPAPRRYWRRRQRGPRFHRRRRRGERWRWQCGFAPRTEGERVGLGREGADLRRALQAYGEGPGRSRSGPISIHS